MANEHIHNEKFEELCTGYVLNALEPQEREEFEAMLQDATDEQLGLYQSLRATANQLAFTIKHDDPSAELKERLMERIYAGKNKNDADANIDIPLPGKDRQKSRNSYYFAIAASFALLLISITLVFYSFDLSNQLSDKNRVIDQQQAQISALKSDVDQKEELLSILQARDVDMVLMAGLDVNPKGYGKVIWDPEHNRALLQVSNLPAVPSNKDYQLWIIKNNKPVSAGIFAVNNPQKDSFFKIEKMASANEQSANAFAVTLEPKGGVPQPTGDMYLMGNFK